LFEQVLLAGVARPDASIAIGLQFDANGIGLGLFLTHGLATAVEFGENACQVLNVMAHFVRQHISLCKIARRAELAMKLIVEAEVDINLLIAGTIKRSHG